MAHSVYFTGPLYDRMAEDLHLGGMSERTHAGYLRAVRKLADYCQDSPDKITEDQLRRFFLHMKNELNYAHGTLRVAFSGIKLLFHYCEITTTRELAHRSISRYRRCRHLSVTCERPCDEVRVGLALSVFSHRAPAARVASVCPKDRARTLALSV